MLSPLAHSTLSPRRGGGRDRPARGGGAADAGQGARAREGASGGGDGGGRRARRGGARGGGGGGRGGGVCGGGGGCGRTGWLRTRRWAGRCCPSTSASCCRRRTPRSARRGIAPRSGSRSGRRRLR